MRVNLLMIKGSSLLSYLLRFLNHFLLRIFVTTHVVFVITVAIFSNGDKFEGRLSLVKSSLSNSRESSSSKFFSQFKRKTSYLLTIE